MRKKFLLLLAFYWPGDLCPACSADHVPDQTKRECRGRDRTVNNRVGTADRDGNGIGDWDRNRGADRRGDGRSRRSGGPEKIETHLIIASDTHYMSPSLTDYGVAFDQLVNSSDGKEIRYQPQLWQAFESEVLRHIRMP